MEASPHDRIWGIGLGAADERATGPVHWRGLNLLAFALMEARSCLLTEEDAVQRTKGVAAKGCGRVGACSSPKALAKS